MKDHEIIELYWARNESAITATTEKYGNYCHIVICSVIYPLSQMKRPICAPRKSHVHFQKESRNAKRRLRCLR